MLYDFIAHCIQSLEVCLDAQFVVSQMKGEYCVHNPMLRCLLIWVRLLECSFDHITYVHVPIISNSLCDAFSNYVLDWKETQNYICI